MSVIHHPKKKFTGNLVVGARRYEFEDGVATADLTARDRVYLGVYGFDVSDPVVEDAVDVKPARRKKITGAVVDGPILPVDEGEPVGGVEHPASAVDLPED